MSYVCDNTKGNPIYQTPLTPRTASERRESRSRSFCNSTTWNCHDRYYVLPYPTCKGVAMPSKSCFFERSSSRLTPRREVQSGQSNVVAKVAEA